MRISLIGAAALLFVAPAWAQGTDQVERFQRTLDEIRESHYEVTRGKTLTEHARLLYGAYTTLSFLAVDRENGTTRVLRQADGRFWAEARARGHTFYGRIRLQYQDFDAGDSFTGSGDGLEEPVGDRYWYRFDWRTDTRAETGEDPGWNWWVQLGRQNVKWVSGITLDQVLYAARLGLQKGKWRVGGLLGFTPSHSFIDFDASRPNFTSDTDRIFWGVVVQYDAQSHQPYVYVLDQRDENDTVLPGGLRFGYESTYVAVGSVGQIRTSQWLYRAEFIYEFGDSTSDLLGAFPQTVDDIRAWAGRLQVSYLPFELRRTLGLRVEIEVLLGSGDDDRLASAATAGGNTSGTEDESFNAFGFVNTGLALAPELANLVSVRIGASAFPFRGRGVLDKLRISLDTFLYMKMDDNAPLSITTTSGESFVGVGVDIAVAWILTSDTAIDVRYGIFIPGEAVPGDRELHFGYVGVSYGF